MHTAAARGPFLAIQHDRRRITHFSSQLVAIVSFLPRAFFSQSPHFFPLLNLNGMLTYLLRRLARCNELEQQLPAAAINRFHLKSVSGKMSNVIRRCGALRHSRRNAVAVAMQHRKELKNSRNSTWLCCDAPPPRPPQLPSLMHDL